MKVKELIKILKKADPDALVVVSSDGEGNNYSPVCDFDDSFRYEKDTSWSGVLVEKDDEDDEDGERWDAAEPCFVMWPIN
jgi:hypothetical protein